MKQFVVTNQERLHRRQGFERVGLFNEDGTPFQGGGGSDLGAIGTFLESASSWGLPGFVDPVVGDSSQGWIALSTGESENPFSELVLGYGDSWFVDITATPIQSYIQVGSDGEGNPTIWAHVKSEGAQLLIDAKVDQEVPLLLLRDEADGEIFSVGPTGVLVCNSLQATSTDGTQIQLIGNIGGVSLSSDDAGVITLQSMGTGAININGNTTGGINLTAGGGGPVTVAYTGDLLAFYGGVPTAKASHPADIDDVIQILTDLGLCAA